MTEIEKQPVKGRGFAGMSPERRREIASLGGHKAHQLGLAHQWTSETAAQAGHKGGTNRWRKQSALSAQLGS